MGLIGKIIAFSRRVKPNGIKFSEVKADVGGGDIRTAEHYAPIGDDSVPLLTDKAIGIEIPRTGGIAVIGYLNPINDPVSQAGEKRIYAREATNGTIVCEIYLKSDGSVKSLNSNGSFELKADGTIEGINNNGDFKLQAGGDFIVNKVTIDTSGNITTPSDVTAGTISLKTHVHPAGTPPGPTGAPIP